MIRTAFLAFCLALLASCANKQRLVHIVTNCNKISSTGDERTQQVRLSDPGIYTRVQEVELDAKTLVLNDGTQSRSYTITEPGQYVINLQDDTLLSNPAQYKRETDVDFHFDDARIDAQNWKPSGNPGIDSMMAKTARAQEASEKRKAEERRQSGRSEVLTIFPDSLVRISGNASAKLFVLTDAPKRVEGTTESDVEYYEINTYSYWKDRIRQEFEKEMSDRKDPYSRFR
jgi:hypothetical protein